MSLAALLELLSHRLDHVGLTLGQRLERLEGGLVGGGHDGDVLALRLGESLDVERRQLKSPGGRQS